MARAETGPKASIFEGRNESGPSPGPRIGDWAVSGPDLGCTAFFIFLLALSAVGLWIFGAETAVDAEAFARGLQLDPPGQVKSNAWWPSRKYFIDGPSRDRPKIIDVRRMMTVRTLPRTPDR